MAFDIGGGMADMYAKYRDIDEDEILAGLTDAELEQLINEMEEEDMNPVESTRHRVIEKNYDIEEKYAFGDADQAALQSLLSRDPKERFERQVPDHIRFLQNPQGLRPVSPSEMDRFPGRYEGGGPTSEPQPQLRSTSTRESVQYENNPNLPFEPKLRTAQPQQPRRQPQHDPSLPFTPSLRKASQSNIMASKSRVQPDAGDDDEEGVNTNVPEEIVRRVAMNDETLTEVNLNNIIGVPEDVWVALMEALAQNDVVEKVFLSNTGLKDRVAKACAQMLRRNTSLAVLNIESNFIAGDGAVAIIKAMENNTSLRELRIDNQRHIFGQKVEQEFTKRLKNNTTLTRFGYSFQNPGLRMACSNLITRNVDHCRKQRVAFERGQILAGHMPAQRPKPRPQRVASVREPRLGNMTLPRIGRPDQEDTEIADILAKLGGTDIAKLQSWLNKQVPGAPGYAPAAPAPPPPPGGSQPKKTGASRKQLFNQISSGQSLKSVKKPQEQKIVLPDPNLPMPDDERKRGILSKGHFDTSESYEVKVGDNPPEYQSMSREEYSKYRTKK